MTAGDALPVPKAPLLISLLELEQCLRARLDFAQRAQSIAGTPNFWRAKWPPVSRQHGGANINCAGYSVSVDMLACQRLGVKPNAGQIHMGTPTFGYAAIDVKPNVPLALTFSTRSNDLY